MRLREEVPPHIVKGANLNTTINALFDTFVAGEQKNAELVNKFFEQTYFRGESSLIDKFTEVQPNLEFNDIKDEGITLALLLDDNCRNDFKLCLDNIGNDNIKKSIIQKIFSKVQSEIGSSAPYDNFNTECAAPGDTNVIGYFQTILDYLTRNESVTNGKKVVDVLKNVVITNQDLNSSLPAGEQILGGVSLKDSSIPQNTKKDFDVLLSFEIGKEADRMIDLSKNISNKLNSLYTNTLPAINTIIGEVEEYKYDESKLGTEYQRELQELEAESYDGSQKTEMINSLRWKYYLQYLKTKNNKIGDALEQLYNNNFDYSKLENSVLKGYLEKVADIRLKMLFDSEINEIIKINAGNKGEFADFYKKLADPSETNIQLRPGINLPVEKKIVEGENKRLDDINQFGKEAKPFDAIPITYRIKKSDIDALPFNLEDRIKFLNFLNVDRFNTDDESYTIEGKDVGNLIFLFFVVNSRTPITTFDGDKLEDLQRLFGQAKTHEKGGGPEDNSGDDNQDNDGDDESTIDENTIDGDTTNDNNSIQNEGGIETFTPEKFKEEIEKLGPGKFENGSEIWMPFGASKLPGGGYQRIKIKISDIDTKRGVFTGTFFGGEFEFSTIEGKSIKFDMNKKTLNEFGNLSSEGCGDPSKVYLLPDPSKSDFNSFKDSLQEKLGSFPVDGVTWNGNKFMQKIIDENGKEEDVEVKYFGASSDEKSTYKIEYNPHKRSFTVLSSYNGEEKGKDGESETKRFSYKRDMDWNNFLIFFSQKGLYPQTEEEANGALMRQDEEFKVVNGGHWKLNRFSINNIKHGFKDIFGTLKKGIDNYNKQKDEEFRKAVESPILDAMGVLPFLPPSLKSAIGERQQEIYNEQYNGAWSEIEKYLKALQSDDQFADTFNQVPPHVQTLYGKSYEEFITGLFNRKGESSTEEKRKAAALLLANIQKGGSPYRGLSGRENTGLWVKVILGQAHYNQFMIDKQKCINDLKAAGKEIDQIEDVLATCEMDYIINNVNGANGKLKYFGSHEKRGIPGNEDDTNYKPNPSKILLSEKFANELKNSYKGWFNKSAVDESFNKITHNDFNLAKEDFKRLIKSSRFPGAIGNLEKMFLLARNNEQKSEYQKCFLIYMLSGVLDFNGKKDLRKQTYQRAKTMGFLPGMLAKEVGHSEKVAALLDDFCQEEGYPKFSESVTSYFRNGDLKKGEMKIDSLIKSMDSWWDTDKMENFEKYSKSKFPTKKFLAGSVLDKLQEDFKKADMENIDISLLDNPIIANSGGLLSNANVVRDRMAIKDGEFDGKDPDERENRRKFWEQITKEVRAMDYNDANSVNLVLNQYLSRFGLNSESDRQKAYQWVKTAYFRKDKIGEPYKYDFTGKGTENGFLDMGKISIDDIKDIIWYTFQGTVRKDHFSSRKLPSQMEDALKEFQTFFRNAFEKGTLKNSIVEEDAFKSSGINVDVMLLGSRDVYRDIFNGDGDNYFDDGGVPEDADLKKDSKARRRAKKKAFQSGRFINHELAQIEKSFKNRLPKTSYRVLTQDTTSDIDTRIRWLNKDDVSDAA